MNVKNSVSTWSQVGGNTIGGGGTKRTSGDYDATTKPPINPSLCTVPGDSDTFTGSTESPVDLNGGNKGSY